ncbi:hypothetical protein LEM8419_03216 [Neolewinella maritima]|uniref:Sulfatase-modifying factor enzyme-like domain-containing protein n=1 Tax=Neolewinella maritima TaxID=1383882 RepID=A0ABN8F5V4_9BACT|nr:SUMF1/EgtB/PvdO family nonheme iron enzyme [Neolewinella maritima]CAH1002296.1 hypothetical protein LEM8419_03216 [Neolewinella maritima]
MRNRFLLITWLTLALVTSLPANNIQVSDVRIDQLFKDSQYAYVNLDVSWENSWRLTTAPGNYDAAWTFVKYREGDGPWKHATILGAAGVTGANIALTADQRGAFVYRSSAGTGAVNFDNVRLLWDYGADGVEDYALVTLQVFAIEMVYVNQASFYLADGQGEKFYPLLRNNSGGGSVVYRVTSESPIVIGTAAGNLTYGTGGTAGGGGDNGTLPAAYPKGFKAFYCMKYEVTQQQWVDFFNTLTPTQQTTLDITDASGKASQAVVVRNGVTWSGSGPASTSRPFVPVNFVSPARSAAFLDWSGLRPMTELEFEKAARGPLTSVTDEGVWGTTTRAQTAYTIANLDLATERISNPSTTAGNVVYSLTQPTEVAAQGPLRTGAVAGSPASPTRQRSGAGYYGAMDLAGNVSELTVTVGNATGRAFNGLHGDGTLTTTGASNVSTWPPTNTGYGERGGDYSLTFYFIYTSEREFAATTSNAGIARRGFRGVRTAP